MKCSLLTLSTFIDGELQPRARGEVEAHLVACERCSRAVGHLREETERISKLGRVHVADHSVQTLMEQLGLLAPGTEMGPRPVAQMPESGADSSVPPWLAGDVGQALPWRAKRSAVPPMVPRVAPRETRATPAASEGERDSGESSSEPHRMEGPTMEPRLTPEISAVPVDPNAPVDHGAGPEVTLRGGPAAPHDFVVEPRPAPIADATSHVEPEFQLEPWSPPGPPGFPPIAEPDIALRTSPPNPNHGEFALTHQPGQPDAPVASYVPAEAWDPVDYELPAQPRQWPPPSKPVKVERGFLDRVRDAIETRRAVRRISTDDSVEIVSGTGAPNVAVPTRRRVQQARDAAEQERRLQSAAAAAAPQALERIRAEFPIDPVESTPVPPAPAPQPPVSHPVPPVVPEAVQPPAPYAPAVRQPLDPFDLDDLRADALRREPVPMPTPVETNVAPVPPQPMPPVRATTPRTPVRPSVPDFRPAMSAAADRFRAMSMPAKFDQRLVAAGAGAVLLLVIGIATGKTTSKIQPAATNSAANSAKVPPAAHSSAPKSQPPVAQSHSAAPIVSAAPPSAQPQQLTSTQTLGSGGTGYSIGDVRYGQHAGYFRIVFDISGGSGSPSTVIGFKSPTVMDVVFSGTAPSGATGVLPNRTTVTDVTILPKTTSGQTVYEFTLAHPVTAKGSMGSGPTRLIIDLT
jgi:hypothetical protein